MLGSSECSSGCESGWTLYLDHSASSSPNTSRFREINGLEYKKTKDRKASKHVDEEDEQDEEEDLSMVSDASSGPPIFNEDEACDFGYKPPYCVVPRKTSNSVVRPRKQSKRESKDRKMASFLDDTASSPFINFPNSNPGVDNINNGSLQTALDYSQGLSATRFQGRPAFQDHYGFFQSSISGNQFQNDQWF